MVVGLIDLPSSEQSTLRAAQIIDNVARVDSSRKSLGGMGAVQYLVGLLGK